MCKKNFLSRLKLHLHSKCPFQVPNLSSNSRTLLISIEPKIGAPQYVRQMLTCMKGEINNNTIIVGDFNTPLTPMSRSTKQKINKETQTLNDTIDQLALIDIYRTFHPQNNEFHLFLKCTWNLLQDRSHPGP